MKLIFEFACHDRSCAPPPAGHGGSSASGGRALTKGQASKLHDIATDKRGWGTATQSEAAPLLKRGLIERLDGKGKGMGNSPVWRITAEGRKAAGIAAPAAIGKVKFGGKEYDLIENTGTHYRVVRPDGMKMLVPHSVGTVVNP